MPRHRPRAPPHEPALNAPGRATYFERPDMLDAIFLLTTLAFFAVSLAYTSACDRL